MSTKDYSAELLKMEGVQIEKLDETEEEIILQISMERKMHICKRCGRENRPDPRLPRSRGARFGAARKARAAAVPSEAIRLPSLREALFGDQRFCRALYALYPSHRRKNHGTAAPAQQHEGHREGHGDLRQRRETRARIMPVSKPQRLPQALSFDEFKGDTGGQPFQCIVADPLNRCVFDILPEQNRPDHSGISSLLPQPGRSEVRRHGHEPRLPKHRQNLPAQRPNHYRPVPCGAMLYGGHGERPALLPVFPSQGTEALLQALQTGCCSPIASAFR